MRHRVSREAGSASDGPSERPLTRFGAGNLGRWILRELRKLGVAPAALTDNDVGLWGGSLPHAFL